MLLPPLVAAPLPALPPPLPPVLEPAVAIGPGPGVPNSAVSGELQASARAQATSAIREADVIERLKGYTRAQ
jgi:hypothetical protein